MDYIQSLPKRQDWRDFFLSDQAKDRLPFYKNVMKNEWLEYVKLIVMLQCKFIINK